MRNVRNFWLTLTVDGRSSRLESGPAARNGGMQGRLLQRHQGNVASACLSIMSGPSGINPGTLRTRVTVDGQVDADPERGPFAYLERADGTRVPLSRGDALVLETLRD